MTEKELLLRDLKEAAIKYGYTKLLHKEPIFENSKIKEWIEYPEDRHLWWQHIMITIAEDYVKELCKGGLTNGI